MRFRRLRPLLVLALGMACLFGCSRESSIKENVNLRNNHSVVFAFNKPFENAEAFAYDPDRARKLLAEAVPDGLTIEFRTRALFSTVAQAIQGYWQAAGITCNLEQMENGLFMSDWSAGNLQVLVNGWFADYPGGDGLLSYFMTENAQYHSSFYSDAEFDQLITRARSELDEAAQAELYR